MRPEVPAICPRAIDDAKAFAEKWLKNCMLRNDHKRAEAVAEMLSTDAAYKSHGKVIDFNEAKNVLTLDVEKIDDKSELWSDVWKLYCRSLHQLQQSRGTAKLSESESISLTMSIEIQVVQAPRQAPPPPVPAPQRPAAPRQVDVPARFSVPAQTPTIHLELFSF